MQRFENVKTIMYIMQNRSVSRVTVSAKLWSGPGLCKVKNGTVERHVFGQ